MLRRIFCVLMLFLSVVVYAKDGEIYSTLTSVYDYLYNVLKSVCILSGLFLFVGGMYQYSQYRRDPVCVPFSRVLLMFFCAFCALGLAFIPNAGVVHP